MHIRGARKQEVPMSERCGLLSLKLLGSLGLAAATGGCVVGPVSVRWALPKWAGPTARYKWARGPK